MTSNQVKHCLVLMPFSDRLRDIHSKVYVPTCAKLGLRCWRADELTSPGLVTRDVIAGILSADAVIADLTSSNANVAYELGIAHATGNKTIMTAQSTADVPYDVVADRVLIYGNNHAGRRKLMADLESAISAVLAHSTVANNPFQDVASKRSPPPWPTA